MYNKTRHRLGIAATGWLVLTVYMFSNPWLEIFVGVLPAVGVFGYLEKLASREK